MSTYLELNLDTLCRCCAVEPDFVVQLLDEGAIAPLAGNDALTWRFCATVTPKVSTAWRLHRDLGVNMAGAALALELLDQLETLRALAAVPAQARAVDSWGGLA